MKYSEVKYFGFNFIIVKEDETHFIINNGNGNNVSFSNEENIEFLALKDSLGFTTIDKGMFEKKVSKLDPNLELRCKEFVSYKNWIVRIIEEKTDKLIALTFQNTPHEDGWEHKDNYYLKALSKKDILPILR
jgi:hypothetical protein